MREVKSNECPTCKRSTADGTEQTFLLPELPLVKEESVAELGKKLDETLKGVGGQITGVQESIKKLDDIGGSHSKPSKEFLDSVWGSCPDCGPKWNKIKQDIKDEAIKSYHPAFDEELIKHFDNCPDCKPNWDKFKEGLKTPVKETKLARYFWEEETV